jgi:tRNA C32,U32 (ribose-2'-O)-methylase TrmJ
VQIPANPEFSSLNLASAVQLIGYQLRVTLGIEANKPDAAAVPTRIADLPANNAQFEGMFEHLRDTLDEIDFVDLNNPGKVLRRIRALLQRADLSYNETAIIRGICSAILPPENQNRQPLSSNRDELNV